MSLAKFRYQLTEGGVIAALRDIYNYYYDKTGESYIKAVRDEKYGVFLP